MVLVFENVQAAAQPAQIEPFSLITQQRQGASKRLHSLVFRRHKRAAQAEINSPAVIRGEIFFRRTGDKRQGKNAENQAYKEK